MRFSDSIISGVEYLLDTYGAQIKTDQQLLLAYWQQIDKVEMDKASISTTSFLEKATCPTKILDAKLMITCMYL